VALAALAVVFPVALRADPTPESEGPFAHGAQQFGLQVGGAFGFAAARPDRLDVDHTRMFGVFPRWGIGLSDPLARGTFYEGNVELDLEPMALFNFDPRSGWAAGGSLILHYNFLRGSSIVPYVEGGGGFSDLQFRLRDQSDGFTFPLQVSLGLHWRAFPNEALTLSVGYFHLSNAALRYPNWGINAAMVRIGITAF
jgi:hypothetical protein